MTLERCPEHGTPLEVLCEDVGVAHRVRTLHCPTCDDGNRCGLYMDWEAIVDGSNEKRPAARNDWPREEKPQCLFPL